MHGPARKKIRILHQNIHAWFTEAITTPCMKLGESEAAWFNEKKLTLSCMKQWGLTWITQVLTSCMIQWTTMHDPENVFLCMIQQHSSCMMNVDALIRKMRSVYHAWCWLTELIHDSGSNNHARVYDFSVRSMHDFMLCMILETENLCSLYHAQFLLESCMISLNHAWLLGFWAVLPIPCMGKFTVYLRGMAVERSKLNGYRVDIPVPRICPFEGCQSNSRG